MKLADRKNCLKIGNLFSNYEFLNKANLSERYLNSTAYNVLNSYGDHMKIKEYLLLAKDEDDDDDDDVGDDDDDDDEDGEEDEEW